MFAVQRSYALFDFDGTLIDGDSIIRFLFFARKRGLCRFAQTLRAGLSAAAYSLRLTTAERAKQASLSFLRGHTEAEIAALSRDFCREVLVPALRPNGVEELLRRKAEGCEVLLISASPAFYLEPLKDVLPIDRIIATRFDVADGVHTARIAGHNCKGVEKPLRLAEDLAARGDMVEYAASWGYGDSGSDEPMMALCANKVGVNAGRKLRAALRGADGVRFVSW